MVNFERLKNVYNQNKYGILPITPGMVLELHENVWEWDSKRILKFKWLVIKVKKANHPDGTFTIRGDAARMTVEKIYPLSFPNFEKVILVDDYKIRRSKLYYIRTKVGRDARFKSIIEHGKKWLDLLTLINKEEAKQVAAPKNVKEEVKQEVKTEKVEEPKVDDVKSNEVENKD